MRRIIVICTILLFVIATVGCLDDGQSENPTATTLSMQAYLDKYHQGKDTDSKTIYIWLASLDAGDTIYINDTIDSITYNASSPKNRTIMTFVSVNSSSPMQGGLAFQGNLTDTFHPGDNVTITAHIANVTFSQVQSDTGANWTVHYELLQEQWDTATESSVPLPRHCIVHATDQ
ncbi:MAG: hypothetical protein ACP5FL_05945 [Thermoplasmatota archaeon]